MHCDVTLRLGWLILARTTLKLQFSRNNLLQLQVIFYEQDWNPQVDKQALQRAHRIGQMNHVLCINLVTAQTVEEVRYYVQAFTRKKHMI